MSFRTHVSLFLPLFATALASVVTHAEAAEGTHEHARRTAGVMHETKPSCLKPRVDISDGRSDEHVALLTCNGEVAPLAVERLSLLARPQSAPKPGKSIAALAKIKGPELAPGVRRVDAGLAPRLEQVVAHFGTKHHMPKVFVVSGYRPTSHGSEHQLGRALDFRLEGVANEEIVSFCKTLADTGCGYYPHSSFVHMDVREAGSGHVAWIDASGPGEHPHYVASWPETGNPGKLGEPAPRGAESHDGIGVEMEKLPQLPAVNDPNEAGAPFAPNMTMPRRARSFI